tara:strand:+ start:5795 stop:6043 length:249 start_codon:yes stop_codon:yes gene_type:complete
MGSRKLIFLGLINLLHAGMHLIQFIQSVLLLGASIEHHHEDGFLDKILHNPMVNALWAVIAIFTLYLGIRDFKHHKKCNHEK